MSGARAAGVGWWALLALWAAPLAVALWLRPLLPVDETRYLSVAWEMWLRGDFLVPHLNGDPYSHKPPLLFWLMHAGWSVAGVSETWARLVAPLAALLNLWLTWRLARLVWPERPGAAALAPWLLAGTVLWAGFYTLVQFDLLVVTCTLLGMLGLVHAARGGRGGFALLALAVGLGGLAKGPVILLHVLPAALLAPLWAAAAPPWRRWYGGVVFGIVAGVAIALLWAIPAAISGGEAYRNAIFWGQTADRLVDSFAHRQPWWWYLPLLPVILLPWALWPGLWRAARAHPSMGDHGARLCLAWALPVLLAFTLISGKQVKYLLPLFPALALLAARWLDAWDGRVRLRVPGLLLAASGALLAALPWWAAAGHGAVWLQRVEPLWGLLPMAAGLALAALPARPMRAAVPPAAAVAAVLVVAVHAALVPPGGHAYDLAAVGARLHRAQAAGRPVANVGNYHGQYQFLGRLTRPVTELYASATPAWAAEHPRGLLVVYYDDPPPARHGALLAQAYRGGGLAVWPAARVAARPGLLRAWPAADE